MAARPVRQIRQRRLWPWVTVWALLVLLLCYAFAGFLLLPWWLEKNLPDYAEQQLGWQTTVAEIHANPFTFSAELRDVQANDSDGELVLSSPRLFFNLSAWQLLTGTVSFQNLTAEKPFLRVDVLADGQLSLLRDWQQASVRDERSGADSSADESLPRVYVQQAHIGEGTLLLRDFSRNSNGDNAEFRITPLTLSLQNLATWARPESASQYRLEAMLEQQALIWEGSFEFAPVYSRGSIRIENLGPEVLSYLLAPYTPYQLRSGRVSLSTDYQWQAGQFMELLTRDGQLTFDDATVAIGADREQVQFRSGALTVDQVHFDLAAGLVEAGQIQLDSPELMLTRNADGQIDWMAAGTKARMDDQPANPDNSSAINWSVAGVDIRDGRLRWRDEVPATVAELELTALNLTLGQFTSHLDEPLDYTAQATLVSGGSLDLNGQVTMQPFNLEMVIAAADLDLPAFAPYVRQRLNVELPAGLMSLDGSLDLDQQRTPLTGTFSGSASVTGLEARLPGNSQPLFAWQTLQLAPIEYNVNPARLEIGRITLTNATANIIRNADGRHDITSVLSVNPASASANKESSANNEPLADEKPGVIFRIGDLQLDNGNVRYTDRTLDPELSTRFEQLQGSLSVLSNIPPQQGRVTLKGTVNQQGSLDLNGSIATLGSEQQSDLELKLKNLELQRLSPYSGRYLGYGIAGGKMDMELDYQLQGSRIDGSNHIVLKRLELGRSVPSQQEIDVPIKLGLALLRDDDNVIELNVPVQGDLKDPEFQMGSVTMHAFVNALTKAATSPFAVTGSQADSAGLGSQQVSFVPGGVELTAASIKKLTALAQTLNQKPELALSLRGESAPGVDTSARAPEALADDRATALQQLLVNTHGVDPEQIVVRTPKIDASVDADGNVVVNFTLDAR